MPVRPETTAELAALLARTRQHPYEPQVIAEAAAALAGWGQGWREALASPALLTELPLSVTGCLLAYAAALDEDARPELTMARLQREADRLREQAEWHVARAEDLRRKAEACAQDCRDGLLTSAAAHAQCARDRRAAAARLQASLTGLEESFRGRAA